MPWEKQLIPATSKIYPLGLYLKEATLEETKKDNEHYSIVLREKEIYKQFKEYALELAKPYYVFEGDVLDALRIYREYNGIVELYPLDSFGITHTLANLLSIKNEYRIC